MAYTAVSHSAKNDPSGSFPVIIDFGQNSTLITMLEMNRGELEIG